MTKSQKGQSNLIAPVSIILISVLLAVGLYLINNNKKQNPDDLYPKPVVAGQNHKDIRGIQEDDHIQGDANAELIIVEYSDTECPYCKKFHSTMQRVIDEFGKSGKVAWVYRNFPLTTLHKKTLREAVALECANKLGGNDKFWEYTNMVYSRTNSNDSLDPNLLPKFAKEIGLNVDSFNACLEDEDIKNLVKEDSDEAIASGGTGTPYSVLLYKDKQIPLEGGIPFDDYNGHPGMKSIIENILNQ